MSLLPSVKFSRGMEEKPVVSDDSSVSGSLIGNEPSLYNQNKLKLLSWVLTCDREGTCVAGKGKDAFGQQEFKGSTSPRIPGPSTGGSGHGGSGMKSLKHAGSRQTRWGLRCAKGKESWLDSGST